MKTITHEKDAYKKFKTVANLINGQVYAKSMKCKSYCRDFLVGKNYNLWVAESLDIDTKQTMLCVMIIGDKINVVYELPEYIFEDVSRAEDVKGFTDEEGKKYIRIESKYDKDIIFKDEDYIRYELAWVITHCLYFKKGEVNIRFEEGTAYLSGKVIQGNEAELFRLACMEELGWTINFAIE